ncbi:prepilin-type N-terminal cleavage/methylation domain-containing protein [Radiobacillus kanasensis]|uniref:competence type IV pilus major pilin ComGC n=1 Tax=Radiobacillus kanasensis TaxID=2844358 RepID=UPI001E3F6FA0|nr:competence type IV pilus major pilin ComGC [Radiobacillus kanasensis]UFT97767.1 prepilin-type N-terminal cleavage/methylation domain-containing protein [Radiobacillus kanasensis]
MKKESGFTLIEMLIVLAVISVLLLLLIPNLATKNGEVQDKGCVALEQMAINQVQAYQIDHGALPSDLSSLEEEEYIQENATCSNGTKKLKILTDGEVTLVSTE